MRLSRTLPSLRRFILEDSSLSDPINCYPATVVREHLCAVPFLVQSCLKNKQTKHFFCMLRIPCLQEIPQRLRRSCLFETTSLAPPTPNPTPFELPCPSQRQMLSDGMGICNQVARQPVVVLQPPELRTLCFNLIFLAGFHNLGLVAGCNLTGSMGLLIVQS